MNRQPVRILIVDDHTLLREGTSKLLAPYDDLLVVGEAARGDEVVAAVEASRPDVLLLDIRLPGTNGIEVTREVAARWPHLRVLILSAYADATYVQAAVRAGAAGYLLKTVPGHELADAIRTVHAGAQVFDAEVTRSLFAPLPRAADASPAALTDREGEIVRLVYRGIANKEIAEELGISRRTVEGHLRRLFEKAGVNSRTELARYAVEHRLVATGGEA